VAVAWQTPFISGKDSLNNEFSYHDATGRRRTIAIPPSLLISALGQIKDVGSAVTMDLKQPGDVLYLVGSTKNELGGSHFALVRKLAGGRVPTVDFPLARQTFVAVHRAISDGLVRACHDLSEGGLAVAAAEMAFAGGLGAQIELDGLPIGDGEAANETDHPAVRLFSESNSRFLCEVAADRADAFEKMLNAGPTGGVPFARVGNVTDDGVLHITHHGTTVVRSGVATLKHAWQEPLDW